MIYQSLVRPVLFRADPEAVHARTLGAIAGLGRIGPARRAMARLALRHGAPVTVAGIRFPNRVGLAAGMDKEARAVRAWAALGCGHVEVGTVTARPQPGNPAPRLFRLAASRAILNRMGFNNAGAAATAEALAAAGVRRGSGALGLRVGVSIGKSKTTPLEEAVGDYLTSLRAVAPYADYVAVNVSSPNTPGLRGLQDAGALRDLVDALVAETRVLDPTQPVPLFVKVAPDLTFDALEEVLAACTAAGVRGLIATNTTLARDGLAAADRGYAAEPGGLSGAPLTVRAREVVAHLATRADLPVIGVGGILTADDGRAMLDAGAALLQVYTGLVYAGPRLVSDLNRLRPGA